MIDLFHTPHYTIDTSRFSHWLHDPIVREFEENFCQYVGARYGCSLNSATSGILLMFSAFAPVDEIEIPSIIPPVVVNAILNADCMVRFIDNVEWVGNSYILHRFIKENCKIIDSAQKVERNQFGKEAGDEDIMLFSFFPTKPVGSQDGGMIVSNNQAVIEYIRQLSMNGCGPGVNSWEKEIKWIGHKMYMNSTQAYIANENLKLLDKKKERLAKIRTTYNNVFGYNNSSDHLYRINVQNNTRFIEAAKAAGITCGIHYRAVHQMEVYKEFVGEQDHLPLSDFENNHTVSIPFHENLSIREIEKIIEFTSRHINE